MLDSTVRSQQRANRTSKPDQGAFEIRVRGQLSDAIVSGLGADRKDDTDTTLTVAARDQAELHAFMDRLEAFGLEVISINPSAPHAASDGREDPG